MTKKNYRVLIAVDHDNKRFEPKSIIPLEDEHAAQLLDVNAIELTADAPAKQSKADAATERLAAITTAISQIDRNDPELWSSDGKPKTAAIVALLDGPVSAAERDAAWEAVSK